MTLWGGVAAAVLVLIAGVIWHRTVAPGDGFRVTATNGVNTLTHGGITSAIMLWASITPGDKVNVGETGSVTVQAGDGSTLVLNAAASLAVLDDRPASVDLELEHGCAQTTVTPRSSNGRFALRTPHAEMVVIGTRFTVTVDTNRTSLDVAEGRVRFTPRGGIMRVVAANESAMWPMLNVAPSAMPTSRIVDLVAIADADADEAHPSASFGGQSTLHLIGIKPGRERVSLLRFALPPGRITHAELLMQHQSGSGTVQVRIQSLTGNWRENDLRFYHVPPRGPVAGVLHEEVGPWRCDVTAVVHAGTVEFMLVNTAGTEVTFASREEAGHAPLLRITQDISNQP